MKSIGIAELKAGLSDALRRVREGEPVLITEHGRPVARITALPASQDLEGRVGGGVLRPPDSSEPLGDEFWASLAGLLDEEQR